MLCNHRYDAKRQELNEFRHLACNKRVYCPPGPFSTADEAASSRHARVEDGDSDIERLLATVEACRDKYIGRTF